MKKTYINPSIEVINIHTQQMLATSSTDFGGNTEQNLSRGGRWDDEEEEEY